MRKILSFFLSVLMLFSVFTGINITVNATSDVIYFSTKGWSEFEKLYCHISINGGSSFFLREDEVTLCTNVADDIYSFDLAVLENSTLIEGGLNKNTSYCVVFYTDAIDEDGTIYSTYEMTMDIECIGDTVELTGNMIEDPSSPENMLYEGKWKNSSKRCGPHFAITATGNFVGEYLCPNDDPIKIIGNWLAYNSSSTICKPINVVADALIKFKIEEVDSIYAYIYNNKIGTADYSKVSEQLMRAYNLAYDIESLEKSGEFSYRILKDGTAEIAEYISNREVVEIPSKVGKYTVTSIGYYSFGGCGDIKTITIPKTVTTIKDYAFEDCTSLTGVTIPVNVKSIGIGVFNNCVGMKSINVRKGNKNFTSVDGVLFNKDCTSLLIYPNKSKANYSIPNGVVSINKLAFNACENLKKLTIPKSVKNIGESAFSYCSNLTTIVIPNSVVDVGMYAFLATSWYDLHPDGVIYAGKVAYQYKGTCPAKLVIKNGTKSISNNAFAFSTKLKSITIPKSVKNIGISAFNSCTGLKNVVLYEGLVNVGSSAFEDCKNLKKVIIPASVKRLGTYSFGYKYYYDEKTKEDEYKKVNGFTICGKPGTAAQTYAKKNGFPFSKATIKTPKLNISKKSLKAGKKFNLKVSNADGKKITWRSSQNKVVLINKDGVINTLKKGTSVITAKVNGYGDLKCTIKVTSNPQLIMGGKKIKTITVKKGKFKKVTIKGKVPGVNNVYKYKNVKIAKVTSKKTASVLNIKGLIKGETRINITTNKGYKLTLNVIVK